jgi:hypothetical protein
MKFIYDLPSVNSHIWNVVEFVHITRALSLGFWTMLSGYTIDDDWSIYDNNQPLPS